MSPVAEPISGEHGKHYRVRDDRGKSVSMLDPFTLNLLRRYDVIDRETLGAISQQIGPGMSRARRVWYWILFALTVTCQIFILIRGFVLGRSPDLTAQCLRLVTVVALLLGLFLLWRSARQGRLRRVRSAILDHRCCPHCGYDLRGLSADEEDGATVCPECGCAWKLGEEGTEGPRD